jgi:hypothetical protein
LPGGNGGRGGKEPESESFAVLLSRHLDAGTRPNLKAGAVGQQWTAPDFARAADASDRTVRNWRSGATLPKVEDLAFILDALFGDDARLRPDRSALQDAWDAAHAVRAGLGLPAAPSAMPDLPPIACPQRLFGRDADIARLTAALVGAGERAVLVMGTGGIGKTSLTQRVATEAAVASRFPRRAFVPLETATTATAMAAAITGALGLDAALPLDAVLARLREAPTLLVLDNLETPWHGDTEATEALLARLAGETDAVLLASIRGERVPAEPRWEEHRLEGLSPADAAAMFRDHARRIAADDPHLAPLMEQLSCMPLAIRLVAQRAAGLKSLEGLWAEWQRQGVALATDPDRAAGRLTDVGRSILFSLEAKPVKAAGKRLFALLGQLPAGLTRKDRDSLLGTAGFDAAAQLLGVGLAFDRDGRLDLLPPVRDLARRRFPPAGRDAAGWANHFLALTAGYDDRAWITGSAQAIARLSPEFANIEAAAAAAGTLGLPRRAAAAAWSLGNLCRFTGRGGEALHAIAEACRAAGERLGEANCIQGLAHIASARSDHAAARSGYEEALPIYRAAGARLGEANCIQGLADIARARSDHAAARSGYEDALPIYRAAGDRIGEANCIRGLADIARARSDHGAARSGYEEALPIYRAAGERIGEANCIQGLADIARARSDHAAARSGYEDALPIYRAAGDRLGEANCIRGLADIARARSDHAAARSGYEDALPIYRAAGARLGEANCILGLAHIASARSDHAAARSGYEEALPIYRAAGARLGEANCILGLADIARARSDHAAARSGYEDALPIYRAAGDRLGEANCILWLADIARREGDLWSAEAGFAAARDIARGIGEPIGQAMCELGLGRIATARGATDEARGLIDGALAIFRRLESVWNEADALRSLGDLGRDLGRAAEAKAHYAASEAAFRSIGNEPEAVVSQARLRELP